MSPTRRRHQRQHRMRQPLHDEIVHADENQHNQGDEVGRQPRLHFLVGILGQTDRGNEKHRNQPGADAQFKNPGDVGAEWNSTSARIAETVARQPRHTADPEIYSSRWRARPAIPEESKAASYLPPSKIKAAGSTMPRVTDWKKIPLRMHAAARRMTAHDMAKGASRMSCHFSLSFPEEHFALNDEEIPECENAHQDREHGDGSLSRRQGPEDDEQLAAEPVERRHAGDRKRAEYARNAGDRHPVLQPTHFLDVARAQPYWTAPLFKKSRDLKSAWLKTWKSAPIRPEQISKAEPDHDVADLADTRVCQHALEVALEVGEHRTGNHRKRPQDQEYVVHLADRRENIEENAGQGVDACNLDYDAAQHGRYRGRRRWVRVRQPGSGTASERPSVQSRR